jgi:hypothetical protein
VEGACGGGVQRAQGECVGAAWRERVELKKRPKTLSMMRLSTMKCLVELERMLHNLLHEQNRERIEELEAVLQHAEKKLAEKEMEVCPWKDSQIHIEAGE